jgi:hypothetical protein
MSRFVEAAIRVLKEQKTALKANEICRIAISEQYLTDFGKTPDATMRAQLQVAWRKGSSGLVREGTKYRLADEVATHGTKT